MERGFTGEFGRGGFEESLCEEGILIWRVLNIMFLKQLRLYLFMAGWPSGKATGCNPVILGSNPSSAFVYSGIFQTFGAKNF